MPIQVELLFAQQGASWLLLVLYIIAAFWHVKTYIEPAHTYTLQVYIILVVDDGNVCSHSSFPLICIHMVSLMVSRAEKQAKTTRYYGKSFVSHHVIV